MVICGCPVGVYYVAIVEIAIVNFKTKEVFFTQRVNIVDMAQPAPYVVSVVHGL